ncbi:hypothetical protein CHS0354_040999 [Potamilus streckersoni]|uniref:WD repeat-containing protein 43 n=1 Tax=Potamilus streckersoni TaxID=2493646 RepID=A0AAE0W2L3_9BIVA|nr:hypothetical protein CHS0354_040999 [Potamilus streckersoni]
MESTPLAFSNSGEYFLYSSADGVLKLWETATGLLKQEYTPSSHLSATCSCLSWSNYRGSSTTPRKKKKRKSKADDATESVQELQLVAIGTTSGNLLLYSVAKGDVHSQLTGGHTDTVNGICWDTEENSLYSCSSDHHIVEWEITTGKVKHKWKADKGPVYSICKCSSTHLLSAGRTIKLWDKYTKDIVKTFTGHATEVTRLIHISPGLETEESETQSIESTYFLSAAANDRLVSAWQINTESKDKNAIASFSLPNEPVMLDVLKPTSKDRPLMLLVVTRCGLVHIFETTLNGKLKKPVQPKVTIQVATSGSKLEIPKPIPILAALVCDEVDKNILLVHGNFLKPTLEKIKYVSSNPNVCLVRDDPSILIVRNEASISKVKTPEVSKNMTVLVPGYMAPSAPSQDERQRRKRKPSVGEMSMEERLSVITLDHPSDQKRAGKEPPKADTLARLLTQGLQSQDKKILNHVLQHTDEKMIRNTVRRLPVQAIIPLTKELSNRMQGHAQVGHTQVKWLKMVLTVHTSYLMTFPEIVEIFSSLYQMMDYRVSIFSRLKKLQGKLGILLAQVSSQGQEEEEQSLVAQQPLLQYQEDSSEEDEVPFGLLVSESEDNWEDISDSSEIDDQEEEDNKG